MVFSLDDLTLCHPDNKLLNTDRKEKGIYAQDHFCFYFRLDMHLLFMIGDEE